MNDAWSIPDHQTLLQLTRSDRALAESAFNGLTTEQQSAVLALAPARDRMSLLLLAHDCASLVQSMSAVNLVQTAAAAEDDADVLARFATAEQLAAAIDLGCRRQGRIDSSSFHAWIALLVAASERDTAKALATMDVRLLAVGLKPYVTCSADLPERLRIDRYVDSEPSITCSDLDSDDEEVMAFLQLLEAEAPALLSALAVLLIEEDYEQLFNEDYAIYEERMQAIGLKDHGRAAEVYGPAATEDADDSQRPGLIIDDSITFFHQALTRLIAHRDCDEHTIDRLGRELMELSNDVAMADGMLAQPGQALAAKAKVEQRIASRLRERSHGTLEVSVQLLLTQSMRELFRGNTG